MHAAAHKAITDVEADRQVICTLEEYCTTVRTALLRYAMTQAAAGNPDLVVRVNAEIQRLDTALAGGRWPGAYRSIWERLVVWCGRRHATHFLGRRYSRRARGLSVYKNILG